MRKNIARIILGLVLLAAAFHLHHEGIRWANRALGDWQLAGDPPPARADKWFGPDPDEYAKTPESQEMAAKGDLYARAAYLLQATSCVLILLGTAPYVFILLGWLFIPDLIRERARLARARTESPHTDQPEQETPCDTQQS